MNIAQEPIFQWLSQYAYQPNLIYASLIGMMLLSSIGVPIPEELTLISVGIIAYMGQHPSIFPPPYPGAPVVNPKSLALVAFLSVVFCDFLIYSIGRVSGDKILKWRPVQKVMSPEVMEKITAWTKKYGAYACGIFRFTPGIRFPGHLASGILKFPAWQFILIDGLAAGISVPTQIYLIALYGESILSTLQKVKLFVLGGLLIFAIFVFFKWVRARRISRVG